MATIAQPTTADPAKLLDYQELSTWLNDSVRHLRRLVNERRIPSSRFAQVLILPGAQADGP